MPIASAHASASRLFSSLLAIDLSPFIAAVAADWAITFPISQIVVSAPAVTYPRIRSGCLHRAWSRQTAYLGYQEQAALARRSSRCTA